MTYHITTFEVVIIRPTEIKNINPIAITQVESIVIDFEVSFKKLDILLFPIGCKTADNNLSSKLNTTISRIGESIAPIISNAPTSPTEFLIRIVLDIIKSIPSDKYPPITGT